MLSEAFALFRSLIFNDIESVITLFLKSALFIKSRVGVPSILNNPIGSIDISPAEPEPTEIVSALYEPVPRLSIDNFKYIFAILSLLLVATRLLKL